MISVKSSISGGVVNDFEGLRTRGRPLQRFCDSRDFYHFSDISEIWPRIKSIMRFVYFRIFGINNGDIGLGLIHNTREYIIYVFEPKFVRDMGEVVAERRFTDFATDKPDWPL